MTSRLSFAGGSGALSWFWVSAMRLLAENKTWPGRSQTSGGLRCGGKVGGGFRIDPAVMAWKRNQGLSEGRGEQGGDSLVKQTFYRHADIPTHSLFVLQFIETGNTHTQNNKHVYEK